MPIHQLLSSAFSGKKVWLSGVSGFKGAWLAEWLLSLGAEIRGFSLAPPTTPSLFEQTGLRSRIVWDCADLRVADAVKKSLTCSRPDFVFHLAAQPLVRLSYKEPAGTWETNVMGTINVLESLRHLSDPCVAVMITTDKCYENREWLHGYREEDALGGYDPYSSSKAACELAIASWRRSFFKDHPARVVSARAGNVIGGGDWAPDRIVPDCIRALGNGEAIPVRNKTATRPWQHVLEPLGGYLLLASKIAGASDLPSSLSELLSAAAPAAAAFNFGPPLDSNRTVSDVVREILKHWAGEWVDKSDPDAPHEAGKLNLATDKAFHLLGWQPRWDFQTTVEKTVSWYREAATCRTPGDVSALTRRQIGEYEEEKQRGPSFG
ncbi:MAG: CDP-glucose 4,6-dehydratase [Terrimicrobiaceae bacterium]|nr:CDP-glucose 4,6-dehydratase [Terrimicrobiaceae bacterium]